MTNLANKPTASKPWIWYPECPKCGSIPTLSACEEDGAGKTRWLWQCRYSHCMNKWHTEKLRMA